MTDLAARLRALADQVEQLEPGQVIGMLETLKFEVWTNAAPAPAAATTDTPTALDVDEVMRRTGMSRGWLYREARAGHLPFARRISRRLTFDEAGLRRWLDRRRAG